MLVEGDDFNEPVADAARSILDGHIVLSRALANAKHFPAIDVLDSVSRVRDSVITTAHREAANNLLRLESAYRSQEDLLSVGAYQEGADPVVDTALAIRDRMLGFVRQEAHDPSTFSDAVTGVEHLAAEAAAESRRTAA